MDYGITQLLGATETLGNLDHVAMLTDGRHLEHIGDDELGGAVLGVLVEQFVENLPCVGAVLLALPLYRISKVSRL